MTIVDRVKNIVIAPKTEWPVIAGETATVQSLYTGYILILAAIGPIALGLRFGILGTGIASVLASYLLNLLMVYLVAWIADALAPSFGGEKNFVRSLQLVAYASTAAWLAGIFNLLPDLGPWLSLIAGIYSLYTFFLGAPVLRKCAPDKAVLYVIVVVLCAILAGAVVSWLLFSLVGGGMGGMEMMR